MDTEHVKHPVRTAILVDGGFYRKRAKNLWGNIPPDKRVDELTTYCIHHLQNNREERFLYRVFYYDCPPIEKGRSILNPITGKTFDLSKTPDAEWAAEFLKILSHQRKFALRLGRLSQNETHYNLKYDALKKLCRGEIGAQDLTIEDLFLSIEQKGVDMKIGVDIASLAFKKQVDQIILISGDADFVPAAKQARREGIDFILDPMGNEIKDDLKEHIDGVQSKLHTMYKKRDR